MVFLKHCSINNGIAFHFFEQKEKQAKFFFLCLLFDRFELLHFLSKGRLKTLHQDVSGYFVDTMLENWLPSQLDWHRCDSHIA